MTENLGPRRGRYRGGRWTRVSHGLYRPTQDLGGVRQELEAWQLVLPPFGAFTHLTAAREHGWWLPPLPPDLPVFATMSKRESRPRRDGLVISRHDPPVETVLVDGLPLTAPAETLLQCANDLGLLDLVVLIDAALHLKSCTAEELGAAGAVRRRGAPSLRRALILADGRSESAWESMLRMLHWACDVPVEPQFEVYEDGIFVARGDLVIKGTRTLQEYDGDEHRKKRRHRGDLGRERRLSNAVWTRHGYTSHEVLTQAVAILREADAALGRPHQPERVRRWHRLLAGSLFTPSGTELLRRRWGVSEAAQESGQDRSAKGA